MVIHRQVLGVVQADFIEHPSEIDDSPHFFVGAAQVLNFHARPNYPGFAIRQACFLAKLRKRPDGTNCALESIHNLAETRVRTKQEGWVHLDVPSFSSGLSTKYQRLGGKKTRAI